MPRNYTPLPWKKSFRKIPPAVAAVLAASTAEAFVVGCEKWLTRSDIDAGVYRHLCLGAGDEVPAKPRIILPSPNVGPASFANATPTEVAVKELGTVPKRIQGYAPSWKGSGLHRTTYVRQVWFTRLVVPAMTPLAMELPPTPAADQTPETKDQGRPSDLKSQISNFKSSAPGVRVRFRIEEVLRRTDADFEKNLLRCLNLLQENVGAVGLLPADAGEAEAIGRAAEDIGWEVIPAITNDPAEAEILRVLALRQPQRAAVARARLDVLRELNPRRLWHSTRGYVGYFLAEFADDLTVLENLETDDALYVMRRPAARLSELPRSGLRAELADAAEWIARTDGWQERLAQRILATRGEAPDGQRLLL